MKNYDVKQALPIIVKAAKEYEEKLNNYHFLIIYIEKNTIKFCCVGFRALNFLHLTGVKTKLSAPVFYSACINGKLSTRDFSVDTHGKAQQKLYVLPYLSELLYHNCMIGYFINSGILIRADYFVGDTKAILSVGFRYGKAADIPVSLYRENIKTLTNPTCKVIGIFRKKYNEQKFSEYTYLSKDFNSYKFTNELKNLFDSTIMIKLDLSE